MKHLEVREASSYEDVSSKCADQSFDVGDKLSSLCGELKEGSGSRLGE